MVRPRVHHNTRRELKRSWDVRALINKSADMKKCG